MTVLVVREITDDIVVSVQEAFHTDREKLQVVVFAEVQQIRSSLCSSGLFKLF